MLIFCDAASQQCIVKSAIQINVSWIANNYEFDLLWHYIHSLQIMKIKKYFFITLVCIDLFLGGVEYRHFFLFSTTSIDCKSYACPTHVY